MSQKKVRVGINGFGRIGRILFRAGFDDLEIVGINCLGGAEPAAHLLKYDSTQGVWLRDVEHDEENLFIDGKKVLISRERNPENIPWKEWGVDIVLECTGVFKKKEDLEKHFQAGAKKIIVSAPAEGADMTVVYGINHKQYDPQVHNIVSNASCTTNCLAPVAKILNDSFGIEKGFMTTIHSYTNDQKILDANHKDLRRARAAALSMIPTTTGAAKAVGKVLPELAGKIDGVSVRVPTPTVSLVDLVFESKEKLTKEKINQVFAEQAHGDFEGVLRIEKAPLVSHDFIGDPYSSIVDTSMTMVIQDHMAKVFSWYDNEKGFSCRMVDMAKDMFAKGL